MSTLPFTTEEERPSQVLRASVADAAMSLGPGVTKWMFNNAVAEEDEKEEYDQGLSNPGLASPSPSSEDSHFTGFSSQDDHSQALSRPMISYPTKLTPLSTLEKGYYPSSPFVVVDESHFPRFPDVPGYPYVPPIDTKNIPRQLGVTSASAVSSTSSKSPSTKKPSKGFRFTSKKPTTGMQSPQNSLSDSPSLPPSSLSDPVSRSTTPLSAGSAASPGLGLATPRSAVKLRKSRPGIPGMENATMSRPETQGWDFKDPDRPSFFAVQDHPRPEQPRSSSALGHNDTSKSKKKAKKAVGFAEIDEGYMSEGTGKAKARAKKEKELRPPIKRSMTSRLMSKLSSSDLRSPAPSEAVEAVPPMPSLPHPIHDKFAASRSKASPKERPTASQSKMQNTKNQLSAEGRKVIPEERARSPYLNVNGNRLNPSSAELSPSSSTSSFAIVPDLNGANRRLQEGLGEYARATAPEGHAVGSDNEAKLALLARLITEPSAAPVIEVHPPPEVSNPEQDVQVQSYNFVVPSPTFEDRPSSSVLRYYDVPLSPKSPLPASRTPPPPAFGRRINTHVPSQPLRLDVPTSPDVARSGSAPPTLMNYQMQARGRQAPFPTKPISSAQGGAQLTRSASQSRLTRNPVLAKNPEFLTPKRYEDVQTLPVPGGHSDLPELDLPRSVRSSYSKDLELEEQADERDDRSIYSEASRASFMDVAKSTEARENFMRGFNGLANAKEPGWF